jgi:predicted enzyme related to lactoylglutathione lyase
MSDLPAMKLELVPVPVADVDRAKAFYQKVGFGLNVDVEPRPGMRVVQFTPPESGCSIVFGTGMSKISEMRPGSVHGLHLVVADIQEARQALVDRGIDIRPITNMGGVLYAEFADLDGNTWLLQEFPPALRQPGQSFYEGGK